MHVRRHVVCIEVENKVGLNPTAPFREAYHVGHPRHQCLPFPGKLDLSRREFDERENFLLFPS
jgi:hypothetical protein